MPSFRRRTGALADVKELEYVVALHQTCMPTLRSNGTVSSIDICRFLKSRTNMDVPHEHGIRIVRGLGGGVAGDHVIQSILQNVQPEKKQWEEQRSSQKKMQEQEIAKMVRDQEFLTLERPPPVQEKGRKVAEEENGASDNNVVVVVVDPDLEGANYDDILGDAHGEEYLDVVQIMAILCMPTLARAGKEWHTDAAAACMPQVDTEKRNANYGRGGWLFRNMDDDKRRQQRIKKEHVEEEEEDVSYDESLCHPTTETILRDAFRSMLGSVVVHKKSHGSTYYYPVMDARLVRKLLQAHGEHERAADSILVDKMVQAAASCSTTTNGLLFDEKAFVTALTSDLSEWKVGCEDDETTSFYDVWGFGTHGEKATIEREQREHIKLGEKKSTGYEEKSFSKDTRMKHLDEPPIATSEAAGNVVDDKDDYTMDRPQTWTDIDFSVDAHSSVVLTVVIFFFFMLTSLVYASLITQTAALDIECEGDDFGCTLGDTIVTWLMFAVILTATGYIIIIPLSIGNNPAERSPMRTVSALVCSLIFTWIPYAAVVTYEQGIEPPYEGAEIAVNERNFYAAQWVTRALGIMASLLTLIQLFLALIGIRRIRASKLLSSFFTTSHVRGTARIKKAASRKINAVLENAHRLHPKITSKEHSGPAANEEKMMNFVLRGESFEECGGLTWTWTRLLSGALFDEEGIWIASRLIIIQTVQLCLIGFFLYSGLLLVEEATERAAQAQEDLRPGYPDWVYDIVPTPKQVQTALYPALGVGIFVMIILFLVYLPSYVGRIIQYRCGILPSLKSPDFVKYRIAIDAVYTNIGNAIFGMIGAALLFFFIIALVIFLFVWDFSRDFMILLMAWALGLIITIVLKMVVVKYCRRRHYAGFYRTNPKGANLAVLALECWFIGLGGGVLVGRFTQFILAACFFVGRTDIPFLSRDVALLGYAFDYVPTNFVKDILVHEAHRHPYFERLLAMYMMKLKNDNFGSEAGACWRQLFVVALMPWFIKLRVFSDKRLADSLVAAYNAQRLKRPSALASAEETDDADSHDPGNPSFIHLTENPTSDRKKKKKHKSQSRHSMSKSAKKSFEKETELATYEVGDEPKPQSRRQSRHERHRKNSWKKETELATDEVADEQANDTHEIFEEEAELASDQAADKHQPKEEKREKRKSKSKSRVSKSAHSRSSNEVAAAPRHPTRTSRRRSRSSMS